MTDQEKIEKFREWALDIITTAEKEYDQIKNRKRVPVDPIKALTRYQAACTALDPYVLKAYKFETFAWLKRRLFLDAIGLAQGIMNTREPLMTLPTVLMQFSILGDAMQMALVIEGRNG